MNSLDCQSVLMLVCFPRLSLVRLLADFLYVRAIELLLFYFNLVARMRGVEKRLWAIKIPIAAPRLLLEYSNRTYG
ncbi:MAG: hypothetical protein JGK24_24035 [Microcoleus sp. PH2017_29_MFU_D_A]|uniref:hypothetical protein n=1 Tax=unclassified Microcoleus TaxID=2642155 RepID=UPI001D8905C3|nr:MULTISPECIES: hypothetical protein [unclassified Microcoleus]MCC3420534.1 hypothetical protein [Microcoleus sp. PH2017_07_MST_O_A]MCC3432176.1 hypothetical protein [Microcoleus sp. PH2017_04_SCI_O_A]MCC3444988.1 hypothetical protein [Microcoleus sp. PH2017_03_ELD_O_A]MCC3506117.1 hypothetical protein [Microcoleus sp. PH2017_19_SFW_U_A]MCC3511933.1 hypothetical protein [Microcoleus sp. PH2017_17_BER_D_A]TAE07556.1 MAG: hypothetical protein EAZ94_28225 [Oscillatoriales cyanobacterium]